VKTFRPETSKTAFYTPYCGTWVRLLAEAIGNEFLARDVFNQMLEIGEYENFNKGDIIKAKQKIHSAIQQETQAETAVDNSIDKLDDALDTLGIE